MQWVTATPVCSAVVFSHKTTTLTWVCVCVCVKLQRAKQDTVPNSAQTTPTAALTRALLSQRREGHGVVQPQQPSITVHSPVQQSALFCSHGTVEDASSLPFSPPTSLRVFDLFPPAVMHICVHKMRVTLQCSPTHHRPCPTNSK